MAKPLFAFTLVGDDDLIAALEELPKALAKSTLNRAATKALQPVRDEAEGYALTGGEFGDLQSRRNHRYANSWRVTNKLKRNQVAQGGNLGTTTVYVGSTDRKAHLLEFGHLAVDGTFVRARPVLRPAWDATKAQVLSTFKAIIWDELSATVRRLNKRRAKKAARA